MSSPFIGYLAVGAKYDIKPGVKGIEFPDGPGTKARAVVTDLLSPNLPETGQ